MSKLQELSYIINEFVTNKINADTFKYSYIDIFLDNGERIDNEYEYEIINELFCFAEDYSNLDGVIEEFRITAEELHAKAKETLEKLLALEK